MLLAGSSRVYAQDIAPRNYSLNSTSDFRQYESDVLKCINWLAEHPRTFNPEERRKAEDFLVKWIYGSPYVNIIIEPYIMKLSSKNADLLLSFMFGYAQYQLEHLGDKNLVPANIAGIAHLVKDYQLNLNNLEKDPLIEKVVILEKEGKLTDWLLPQLEQKKLN